MMLNILRGIARHVRWNRSASLLLVLLLAMGIGFAEPHATARAHPILLQLAATEPDTVVAVIVQKNGTAAEVEQKVRALGGTVTKDLHIINAFAAEMNARNVAQLAQADGVRWIGLDASVRSATLTDNFTTWATGIGTYIANGFTNSANMLGAAGPDKIYGYGANVKGSFGGFVAEYSPGMAITKVEVALRFYVPAKLGATETPKVYAVVGGSAGNSVTVPVSSVTPVSSSSSAATAYVDVTATRTWHWSDFKNNLQVVIDQSVLASSHPIYYDAVGLRVSSTAGSDTTDPLTTTSAGTFASVNTSVLSNAYNQETRATDVWNEAPNYFQGQGMTVALVDSGLFQSRELDKRVLGAVSFNSAEHTSNDGYGHGTFIGGVIGDSGILSGRKYIGIAPQANLINVRVSDDNGMAYESDVVNSLQWVNDNRATYNIKVVNLSMNSGTSESYTTNPLDAAVEILWFNGVVVVVSAGNNGNGVLYPPANDPFVITVGAVNDMATTSIGDDSIASYSAYGTDELGGAKPDLVAPGNNIIAYLPNNASLTISAQHPANRVDSNYFRMSGTSLSAPMVTGAAAILLESNPHLSPDQVKYRLSATANTTWTGYAATKAGAGIVDIYAAVHGTSTQSANTGKAASQLLWTGSQSVSWGSVNWGSVNWGSVNWGSVNWGSVNWGSVNWGSDYWGN